MYELDDVDDYDSILHVGTVITGESESIIIESQVGGGDELGEFDMTSELLGNEEDDEEYPMELTQQAENNGIQNLDEVERDLMDNTGLEIISDDDIEIPDDELEDDYVSDYQDQDDQDQYTPVKGELEFGGEDIGKPKSELDDGLSEFDSKDVNGSNGVAAQETEGAEEGEDNSDRYSDEEDKHTTMEEYTSAVIITIETTEFLLTPSSDEAHSHLVALYDDTDILQKTIEQFFGMLRAHEDLSEFHNFDSQEEITLNAPELGGLFITEDNIYSRDITVLDLVDTFKLLQKCLDETCPKSLSFKISTQPRFISKFNGLTELIRLGKGFNYINSEEGKNDLAKRKSDTDNSINPLAKRLKQ